MLRLGVSSVAFKGVEEIQEFYKETGIPIEYGVNLRPTDVKYLLSHEVGCRSIHVPSPTKDFFPNFASRDRMVYRQSMDILKESMETLSECGGSTLVIHPGYALDELVPSDYMRRKPFIEKGIKRYKDYIIDKDGAITGPSYLNSLMYRKHFQIFMENLSLIKDFVEAEGFRIAFENLNPRLYYILQSPVEMIEVSKFFDNIYFCLDFGHLYISSIINGFDFIEGVKTILEEVDVIHFHLSNNPSRVGYYNDAHDHITSGNIDYPTLFPLFSHKDANLILEIKHDPREDISFLRRYGII